MRRRDDWFSDADIDRAHIFVPVIMGAGLLVSAFTLARDALHGRRWEGRERRVALEAHATAHHVLTGEPAIEALRAGVRPRASYVLSGLSSGVVAVYVGIGATLNYLRDGGYVAGIAWLWALSLATTAALGAVTVACAVAAARWPLVARWQLPLLAHTPLGRRPSEPGARPGSSLLLGWAAAAAGAAAGIFTLVVAAAPHRLTGMDEWAARLTEGWDLPAALGPLGPLGPIPVYLVGVAVIGLAGLRCPAVPVGYLAAAACGLLVDTVIRLLISRERPVGAPTPAADSFPSAHQVQAWLLAGFLALALLVLSRRVWFAFAGAGVSVVFAVTAGVSVLRVDEHWLSDLLGGALWGGALALAGWWVIGRRRWHRQWHQHWGDCPLVRRPAQPQPGMVRLPRWLERAVRIGARVWVPAAVTGFVALAFAVGLPANPEGEALTTQVEAIAQLALLGLATVGWLVAWRWEGAGAALLVLAGGLLGVLAALAYHPLVSLAVAVVFVAPAVGFWLVWQHRRTARAVGVLAITTSLLLGGTWIGASAVYEHYYGPAHPASSQRALPVDRVVWSWTGGVTGRQATVVAELVADSTWARLRLRPAAGGAEAESSAVAAGADGVVRLTAQGLLPATTYQYRIEVDGVADASRGAGTLRTMPESAASFTVAVGSCALTGSSGAVYDAIAALAPALYIVGGDLHYGNPAVPSVAVFANLYRRVLTAPAQAALYRQVPVAYVWDDHDYGPNDADASAPTRASARAAYTRYVPAYPRPAGPDGAIYQAFTAGRVRFVLTDTRSERTATSMLGDRQLAWLEHELVTASRTHALVVWVNPDPWIAPAQPGRDDWGGYAAERGHIADTIADAGIGNLVMLAGDAHMVAIDDGSHTNYATAAEGPGFPLLHAAALDRPGGVKGGPYSHGVYPGAGQFGTLSVRDDGGPTVEVTLTGRDWQGHTLTQYSFTATRPAPMA